MDTGREEAHTADVKADHGVLEFLEKLKDTARYPGLLLAPADGFDKKKAFYAVFA